MNFMNIQKQILLGIVFAIVTVTVWAADDYDALLQSMKARQARLEAHMITPGTCLGERLDGFLEINFNCSEEIRRLAEAENKDRRALYRLMATDLGISEEEVGKQRARRYQKNYPKGILREISLSDNKTTWWDGFPPDPRETAVSRVLCLQYARIHEKPDASSPVVRDNLQLYEAFGVVEKAAGKEGNIWYKVTEEYVPKVKPHDWSPLILGWLSEKDVIPWRRALVMRFTNAYQRDPSIFFRNTETILELVRQAPEERKKRLDKIYRHLENGAPGLTGIIAKEPLVGKGQERVIMYPVLDYYSRVSGEELRIDGIFARLLEVAAQARSKDSEFRDLLPIDIVFVMDTTNSMKPYLRMTLEAAEAFANQNDNDELRFGFIGYQDKSPGFDYTVKTFTEKTQPSSEFVRTLHGVKARDVAMHGDDIPEAVFEAVNTALERFQWRENAVKIIFLVGDAPGREEEFNVKILRDKAFTRQISIFAFHIHNSKVSGGYDRQSKDQYRKLSSTFEGAYGVSRETPHLLSIDARSVDFQQQVLEKFQKAREDFEVIRKSVKERTLTGGDLKLPPAEPGSLSELIFQQAMLLLPDDSMPEQPVFGWVCDKVLTNPGREALAPMILLNEAELDELDQRVRELEKIGVKALRGEEGTTLDFFDLVAKNTRFTIVNPSAVNFRDAFSVPLGIDQLPYNSDIMATTREEFHNQDRVQEFVRAMRNKLRHYEDLRRRRGDPAVWKKLSTGASERDRVVGVELNQLP